MSNIIVQRVQWTKLDSESFVKVYQFICYLSLVFKKNSSVARNNVTYFDSFGVDHIPKEIKISIDKYIVVTNIFRIKAYDSVMCGYFCFGFIDFMLAGKTLADLNLFSPNNFKKNDITLKYFVANV